MACGVRLLAVRDLLAVSNFEAGFVVNLGVLSVDI